MDSTSMDTDATHVPVIPGLPDEISLLCLARVPRCHHFTLSCVSKTWRALLCRQEFLQTRQKHNCQETWVYALCKDNSRWNTVLCVLEPQPTTRSWKLICMVPTPCSKRDGMAVETVGDRLYLLGGCGMGENATDEVYCYNASIFHWERVAPMPMARYSSPIPMNIFFIAPAVRKAGCFRYFCFQAILILLCTYRSIACF
jgi:F-box domain/Kelch motif